MSQPPILDYAAPRKTARLRKAAALLLRILGSMFAVTGIIVAYSICYSPGSIIDWLLLALVLPTTVIFLGTGISLDRTVNKWVVWALIAALVNIGVTFSCVGNALFSPRLAPDGLVRAVTLALYTPFGVILLTLAFMLFLILRQSRIRN